MNRTQMKKLFRSLIDEVDSSAVFNDTRIEGLLFEGAQTVQDLLEDSDEHIFEVELDLVFPIDTKTAVLPDNFRKLKQLFRPDTNIVMRYKDPREFSRLSLNNINIHDTNIFTVRGNIVFLPVNVSSEVTIKVVFTAQLNDLNNDTETWFEIPSFARRLVVYEAVYIGLISENSDVSDYLTLLNDVRSKCIRSIENRVDVGSRGTIHEA